MYFYFYFLVTIAQFPWTLFCQRPRPKFFENTLSCGYAQHKMWRIGNSPCCQLREYGKEMYHKCRRGFLKLPNRGANAARYEARENRNGDRRRLKPTAA